MNKNPIRYWRDQIVKALYPNSGRSRSIHIPMKFYTESHKNEELVFTTTLVELSENDETYIKLAAVHILNKFFSLILPHLEARNTVGLYTTKINRIKKDQQRLTDLNKNLVANSNQKHLDDIAALNNAVQQNEDDGSISPNIPSNNSISGNSIVDPAREKEKEIQDIIELDDSNDFNDVEENIQTELDDKLEERLDEEILKAQERPSTDPSGSGSSGSSSNNGGGTKTESGGTQTSGEEGGKSEEQKRKEEEEKKRKIEEEKKRKEEEEKRKQKAEEEKRKREQEAAEDARNYDLTTRKTVIGFIKTEADDLRHNFVINDFQENTKAQAVATKLRNEIPNLISKSPYFTNLKIFVQCIEI